MSSLILLLQMLKMCVTINTIGDKSTLEWREMGDSADVDFQNGLAVLDGIDFDSALVSLIRDRQSDSENEATRQRSMPYPISMGYWKHYKVTDGKSIFDSNAKHLIMPSDVRQNPKIPLDPAFESYDVDKIAYDSDPALSTSALDWADLQSFEASINDERVFAGGRSFAFVKKSAILH